VRPGPPAVINEEGDSTLSAVLEARSIVKSFGRNVVLREMSLSVGRGEKLGIVGLNGSGKTTLVKILAGAVAPNSGEAFVDGIPLFPATPSQVIRKGVRVLHQDLGLIDRFSVLENLMLGSGESVLTGKSERERASTMLAAVGCHLPLKRPVGTLTPAEKTFVALAKVLDETRYMTKVLILDEPTAALPRPDVDRLLVMLRDIAARGTAVVVIGHRLAELERFAERVVVLREGSMAAEFKGAGLPHQEVISAMVGTNTVAEDPGPAPEKPRSAAGRKRVGAAQGVLSLRNLAIGPTDGIEVNVEPGDVVGFAGADGTGRERLADVLSGGEAPRAGAVEVDGRRVRSRREARRCGLIVAPSFRLRGSGVAEFSILENIMLTGPVQDYRRIRRDRQERSATDGWVSRLGIVPTDFNALYRILSGGNKQKVILARAMSSRPRFLVLDEPTAGVDPSTRALLYHIVGVLAADGVGIVMISSDMLDFEICHRVIVLCDNGRVMHLDFDSLAIRNRGEREGSIISAMQSWNDEV
jgi:ribose transport system ATP-binding protein